jgi:hypothetical protein
MPAFSSVLVAQAGTSHFVMRMERKETMPWYLCASINASIAIMNVGTGATWMVWLCLTIATICCITGLCRDVRHIGKRY